MPTTLSAYALERIETLALDVVADGDRVTVVGHDTVRCLLPVKRPGPGVAGSGRCPPRNLAPADLKKDANGFDLSIALGLLLASGQVAFDRPGNCAIVGELALTGETRPVKGVLAMALQAVAEGRHGLLVPTANAAEAAVVEGLNVYPVGSLAEAVGFLSGQLEMDPESVDLEELFAQHSHMDEDFVDVKGQDYAKRPAHRRGRLPQRLDDRPPRHGQNPAREALADHPAAPDPRREPGDHPHLQRHGPPPAGTAAHGRAAFLHAASLRQRRRFGRRRQPPAAGADLHGPQGRPLPRRDARVQPQDPGGPPPAAGGGQGDHQPGNEQLDVS